MQRETGKGRVNWRRHLISFGIFAVLLLADQLSKLYIVMNIPLGVRREVIAGLLNFTHSRNPGGAFSIFADHPNLFLIVSSIAIIILIIVYFKMARSTSTGLFSAVILSGAIGNMIDRFRLGQVVDFIDFYVGSWHWYIFNVADAAITVGAAGLFIVTLISEIKESRREKRDTETGDAVSPPVLEDEKAGEDG
ncbi:MAG: signal peptidase II [bacterium]|nr:signal peptidase II [bacterium]